MGRCHISRFGSWTGKVENMVYQGMAHIYDLFMKDAPYDDWIAFTKAIFKQSAKKMTHVVDLGCGTGEITARLANDGYRMTGVDNSLDMLTHAQHKSSEKSLSIQWLHQDLNELTGLTGLDAAISYCDVINYITEKEDLKNVFTRIANSLKEGGLFIFDVHDLHHVENHLVNQTFADVTDEAAYIWFCMEGEEIGEMYHDLTFFAQNRNVYQRFEEYHHQRTYSINYYKQLLQAAGFKNIKVYADFLLTEQYSKETTERIFFAAEKGSEEC